MKFYVTRSAPNAWRDEDVAMSTVRDGPFGDLDEAQSKLVEMIRKEADELLDGPFGDTEFHIKRADALRKAATEAEKRLLTRVKIEFGSGSSLLWSIHKV